jgi:hypothetical protein
MESPLRDNAFTHFHDRFKNDPLVLDKWMSLQAGSHLPETITAVRELMKHPAFDIKNPNKVRAVVGAFASYLTWVWLLGRYPATKMGSFALSTPLFALFFGTLWLGEAVTLELLLALAVVGLGITLVNRRRN